MLEQIWEWLKTDGVPWGAIGVVVAALTLLVAVIQLLRRPAMLKLIEKILNILPSSRTPDTPEQVARRGASLPSRNQFFTGREDELQKLKDALSNHCCAALSGLGGVGKSQIAAEYVHCNHPEDTSNVFWVRASSTEELIVNLASLAECLNLRFPNDSDQREVAKAVRATLEQLDTWLLVFDSADTPAILKEWIPVSNNGKVIITTQTDDLGMLGVSGVVPVRDMLTLDAEGFLLKRTTRKRTNLSGDEVTGLKDLVTELSRFPLALEQAGAYMTEKGMSFSDYRNLYHSLQKDLPAATAGLAGGYEKSVLTTWSLAFNRVERENPASINVLRFSAFLAPDDIPYEILTDGASQLGATLFLAMRWRVRKRSPVHDLLAPLRRYSLVRNGEHDRTYSVHGLVQQVVKNKLSKRTQKRWIIRAVNALSETYPSPEFGNWERCDRFTPHAKAAFNLVCEMNIQTVSAAHLLNKTAHYLDDTARFDEALPLYERALVVQENTLGPDHPSTATSLNNLAELYRSQGRYDEALPLYERALEITEKALGPDHPDTTTIIACLAEAHRKLGRYDVALPLITRALEIAEKVYGPEHLHTGAIINNLAGLFTSQGRYADAMLLRQRALDIAEKTLGWEHPNTATSINNLATLYCYQGLYDEAMPKFERALAIQENALGREHPSTATTLNNMAGIHESQGRYDEAMLLYKRALKIYKTAFGTEHPEVGTITRNLGKLFRLQERFNKAFPFYEKALAIHVKALGSVHPETALSRYHLAELLESQGQYYEACPLYSRALKDTENARGRLHPYTRLITCKYACTLDALNRHDEAAELRAKYNLDQPPSAEPTA
jgi:tetratricopeptide (TPR) repeat protein